MNIYNIIVIIIKQILKKNIRKKAVYLFHSLFNLYPISLSVYEEDKSVIVLYFLHCSFSSQGVFQDSKMIQPEINYFTISQPIDKYSVYY